MLRRVLADNPSPLTGPGTNSFLIGRDAVTVIDPGPDLPAHRAALIAAAAPGRIARILVTHSHVDHAGGANALAAETGAVTMGFGAPDAGRSPAMAALAAALAPLGGGEGVAAGFVPAETLADGAAVAVEGGTLRAWHLPGHFGNHLAFQWGDAVFCGDLVLGWASTLISPPDGDLGDYLRSLARLAALAPARLLPGHGDPVRDPAARIAELAAHRRARTAQIMAALADGPATAADLAARLYDVPATLLPAAARNVLAHLIALADLGAVSPDGTPGGTAAWRRA